MAEIRRYVIVDENNHEEDWEYDTFDEAQTEAVKRITRPVAVVAKVYEYSDSELVWTSTGHDTWPPPRPDKEN